MKIGDPSTDLNARTGEFTPPGKYVFDVSYNASEVLRFNVVAVDSICLISEYKNTDFKAILRGTNADLHTFYRSEKGGEPPFRIFTA